MPLTFLLQLISPFLNNILMVHIENNVLVATHIGSNILAEARNSMAPYVHPYSGLQIGCTLTCS